MKRGAWSCSDSGAASLDIRLFFYQRFLHLTQVGDTSLDLPEATCLIQISSQFGSRRQEAQRMGRILRAKRRNEEGFRSRFFTLVSRDTDEVAFSSKRKRFLIDQGYEFKVSKVIITQVISDISKLIPKEILPTLKYYSKQDQDVLLKNVLSQNDSTAEEEILNTALDDIAGAWQSQQTAQKKKGFKFTALTPEEKARREKHKQKEKNMHPLFKNWKKT